MLVHAYIYQPHLDPGSAKNDKAVCTVIKCGCSDNCGLLRREQCSFLSTVKKRTCPYGEYTVSYGFTYRSNKYFDWIKKRQSKYEGVSDDLGGYTNALAVIGEYVFVPYTFIDQIKELELPINRFVPREEFTVDFIIKICEGRPQAIFGGEIVAHQKREVPLFVAHLYEKMPEIYTQLCEVYPRAKKIMDKHTNVGREAILETLKPSIGKLTDIHGASWVWDGEYLTSYNSKACFMLVRKFSELRIKPKPKQIVKIGDDGQVTNETVFIE